MKKAIFSVLKILSLLYILLCVLLFAFQEKILFHPEPLANDHQFRFDQQFEEMQIRTDDGIDLHALLFPAEHSKGLIYYLHGNAGSLRTWGEVAKVYTDLQYDVCMLDYRGYGKSEGTIRGQEQLFEDVQTVYDTLKKQYAEDQIIVLGYSIGTGPASKIASTNHPRLLILQAPYYSMTDLMQHTLPLLPAFLLRYPLETHQYLKACEMPVVLFHGTQDEVIDYRSSLKLQQQFKPQDTLITLEGQGHNGMTFTEAYLREVQKILESAEHR